MKKTCFLLVKLKSINPDVQQETEKDLCQNVLNYMWFFTLIFITRFYLNFILKFHLIINLCCKVVLLKENSNRLDKERLRKANKIIFS